MDNNRYFFLSKLKALENLNKKIKKLIAFFALWAFLFSNASIAYENELNNIGLLRARALFERTGKGIDLVADKRLWIRNNVPELAGKFVGSFCMEACLYGLSPDARDGNFAGGLGIDEGDWGEGAEKIGLNGGIFMPAYATRKIQKIRDGRQVFDIVSIDYKNEPIEEAKDRNGNPMEFDVWGMEMPRATKDKLYHIKVFKVKKEGTPIYLFRCPEVFDLLYPSDEDIDGSRKRNRRFLQETVYAKCVFELFKRVDFLPDVYHLNEGHVGFVLVPMSAFIQPHTSIIYVNHSVVDVALERFHISALDGGVEDRVSVHAFPSSTRWQEYREKFTVTAPNGERVIDLSRGALTESTVACAVSNEHAGETEKLFPWYKPRVRDVLNGSGDFWVMDEILDMEKRGVEPTKEDLVRINKDGEKEAFALVKARTADMTNKKGELICPEGFDLDPSKQTVWLVRRIAEYKSQMPVLKDIIRVMCADRNEIVETRWGPMRGLGQQVVVGGIAPEGTNEEEWVEEFVEWMDRPELKGRFVFVPGAGSELLRAQSIGGGICINSPVPKKEACGTSDQRKARNGGINIATRSGGPPEYIEDGKSGFLVGRKDGPYATEAEFYANAPKDILDKLTECSRMFYEEPDKLAEMMLASYRASKKVTDEAMVKRYATDAYRPALRIKRFFFLGKRIGQLALQQAREHPEEKVTIVFGGLRTPQKSELMDLVVDMLKNTGVKVQIGEEEQLTGPESLSFEGNTIRLNTDVVSEGLVDTEKLRALLQEGIKEGMSEKPVPAASPAEPTTGALNEDILSAVLRPRAHGEHEQTPAARQTDEIVCEINMRTLHKKFSEITNEDILRWKKETGATILWFMGACELDPYSEKYNKFQERRWNEVLPRSASAYSVKEYKISEALGGDDEFLDLVELANKLGVGAGLDVVPNHMGAASPLVDTHPELFLTVDARRFPPGHPKLREAEYLLKTKDARLIREPNENIVDYFIHPAVSIDTAQTKDLIYCGSGVHEPFQWMDTAQFNWTKAEMREYMRQVILRMAYLVHASNPANKGLLRFDMIYYTFRNSIRWFWFGHLSDDEFNELYPEKDEFWKKMIPELRRQWPNIVLVGEMYGSHGHGNPAHEIGLDYYYEDYFRRCLENRDIRGLRGFLQSYVLDMGRRNLMLYVEGHDISDRIAGVLGKDASLAAVALLYTLPGGKLIYHDQQQGYVGSAPKAALIDLPPQEKDPRVVRHYQTLSEATADDVFRHGGFRLLETNHDDRVIAFEREYNGRKTLVVINYSEYRLDDVKVKIDGHVRAFDLLPWDSRIVSQWWLEKPHIGGLLDPMYAMVSKKDAMVGDLAGFEEYPKFMVSQGAEYELLLPVNAINPNDPSPYFNLGFFTHNAIAHLPLDEVIGAKNLPRYEEEFIQQVSSDFAAGRPLPNYFNLVFIRRLEQIKNACLPTLPETELRSAIATQLRTQFHDARSGDLIDWPLVMAFNEYCLRRDFDENQYNADWNCLRNNNTEFQWFLERNQAWVKGYGIGEYALFHSLFNDRQTGDGHYENLWWNWNKENLDDPNSTDPAHQQAIQAAKEKYKKDILFYEYLQWRYSDRYKKALASYRLNNKKVVVDLPLFAPGQSATMWALQKCFDRTKSNGAPAGPEAENGQIWYTAPYRFENEFDENMELRDEHPILDLWENQIRHWSQYGDALRIDHIYGFIQEFIVDEGKSAREGHWNLPNDLAVKRGRKILERFIKAAEECGVLLIVEDVGIRDWPIRKLLVELSLEHPNFFLLHPIGWRDTNADRNAGAGTMPPCMIMPGTADTPLTSLDRLEGELNKDNGSRYNLVNWLESRGVDLSSNLGMDCRKDPIPQNQLEEVARLCDEAIMQEPFFCLPMKTIMGKGHRINIPGVGWDWPNAREIWSGKHESPEELLRLPNLGWFDQAMKPITASAFVDGSNGEQGLVILPFDAAMTSVLRPKAAQERKAVPEAIVITSDTVRFMLEDGFLTRGEFETIVSDPMFNRRYEDSLYFRDVLRMQYFEGKQEKETVAQLQAMGINLKKVSSTTKTRWLELMGWHPIILQKAQLLRVCMDFVPQTHDFRRVAQLRYGFIGKEGPMQSNKIAKALGVTEPFVYTRYRDSMQSYIRALVLGDAIAARKILEDYAAKLKPGRAWNQDEITRLSQEIRDINIQIIQQPPQAKPLEPRPKRAEPPQPRLAQPKAVEKPKQEPDEPEIVVAAQPKAEEPSRSAQEEEKMRSLNGEAKACLGKKQYEEGIRYADEALKIDKRNIPAMLTKALCLYNLRRYKESRALLVDILDSDPDNRIASLQLRALDSPPSATGMSMQPSTAKRPEHQPTHERPLDERMGQLEFAVDNGNRYRAEELLGMLLPRLQNKFPKGLPQQHARVVKKAQAFLARVGTQKGIQGLSVPQKPKGVALSCV